VADDHPVFREGLVTVLGDLPDVTVVAQVASGEEAVAAVEELAPDVVVMDLRMPGEGGVAATARLTATRPSLPVLVLTMSEDDDSLFAALRAGARGYLLKEATSEQIGQALHAVARGEAVFGARVADRVLTWFTAARTSSAAALPSRSSPTASGRSSTWWRGGCRTPRSPALFCRTRRSATTCRLPVEAAGGVTRGGGRGGAGRGWGLRCRAEGRAPRAVRPERRRQPTCRAGAAQAQPSPRPRSLLADRRGATAQQDGPCSPQRSPTPAVIGRGAQPGCRWPVLPTADRRRPPADRFVVPSRVPVACAPHSRSRRPVADRLWRCLGSYA
jgi:DNA-binding NarL/FixJ family response regulator